MNINKLLADYSRKYLPKLLELAELLTQDKALFWYWRILALFILFFSFIYMDIKAQITMVVLLLSCMFVLRKFKHIPSTKIFFLLIATFLSLRYFFWRVFETIIYNDPLSFICAIMLFFAELYGMLIHLVSIFVNAQPLERTPIKLSPDPSKWPSVDIMVPSYNEDPDLLEITLISATQISYPANKLNVYLLDDGGTVQKRNDSNPKKAEEARQRHENLRALCAHVGAGYLTREKNLHAKAGNINSALHQTNGDLVLILDADHVPTCDILEKTVGWFEKDEKLFLLQTPHFFINPDPIEKNLNTFDKMPSENEMFYSVIQKGLDFWDASFFCGSAAVLRRKYLMEIGGISGDSITEDAETALELHSRGYRSAYIGHPMIAGLQPETFGGFTVQRTRWAQGMVQIFLLKNPLLKKGLSLKQRLCYFNSSFFWFFSYSRIIFLFAPAAYLFFGLQIYQTNIYQFLGYALPHLIGSILTQNYLFSKVRWIIISELYELMQSVFALPDIIRVFLNPRSPSFAVTPKGEQLDKDFISPLSFRFYMLLLLNIACVIFSYYRYQTDPRELNAILITTGWAFFNVLLTLASLGALREKKQLRVKPRMPTDVMGQVLLGKDAEWISCHLDNLSVDGAGITFPKDIALPSDFKEGQIRVRIPSTNSNCKIKFDLRHKKIVGDRIYLGVQFHPESSSVRSDIVELMHGESSRWSKFLEDRSEESSIGKGAVFFVKIGIRNSISHIILLLKESKTTSIEFLSKQKQKYLSPVINNAKKLIKLPFEQLTGFTGKTVSLLKAKETSETSEQLDIKDKSIS